MIPVDGQDLSKIPPGEELVKLNLNARFFWEDLPYGLVILKDIGDIVGVKTPNIVRNIIFHQRFMPVKYIDEKTGELIKEVVLKESGAPSAYGITNIHDLVKTSIPTEKKDIENFNSNIFFKKNAKLWILFLLKRIIIFYLIEL